MSEMLATACKSKEMFFSSIKVIVKEIRIFLPSRLSVCYPMAYFVSGLVELICYSKIIPGLDKVLCSLLGSELELV